ncbi:peroxidase family protein [Lewinella sp. W8]|uniref:peroxidase family protein n=1 Tax=Lewinella sp. W8 TaxID=2528208 RepID=UPI0015667ECD|nr:peroxidase family protein [Lewinella sp. W8]
MYRTIDGRFNNRINQQWGATHTPILRVTGNGFADGYSAPAGPERPNPRVISNAIFAQDGLLNDPVGLSDFTWVFGQFIDHDITLTEIPGEPIPIPVPMGDPNFDPFFTGNVMIPMTRNGQRFGTGLGPGNPREYDNEITAFIDGSAVYHSEESAAQWLRTGVDGKLKVSAGNLLPYNTVDGEFDSPVDPNAPHMADGVGVATRLFVAGDVRVNENPLLTTFHTLFVREHNRQCDLLKAQHPDWSDDELYEYARKIVGGLIQSIVYDEWLPAMGVEVAPYDGYDSRLLPQIANVFSAAAFRVGHTLLNSNLRRLDANGQRMPDLGLREAFFRPDQIPATGGLEPFLRGMAEQVQQRMDNHVVDDVRNFLFGPPGAGGLDLASINIMRGRERGLPLYNSVRLAYGLGPVFEFSQINPDPDVYEALAEVYNDDINQVDPWVGMLAERPMDGSIFGPTIRTIMKRQFEDLRDGDRFFYLNDPLLTEEEKEWITNTSFRDVVMYNTEINLMQDNVFEATPFSDMCGAGTVATDGVINLHTSNVPLPEVTVDAIGNDGLVVSTSLTSDLGFYDFEALPACQMTSLTAARMDTWDNGINILDMVAIQRHVLGLTPFTNPYQYLAADANGDASIDVFDIVALSRLILGRTTELQPAPVQPWLFIPAAYEFTDAENPFADDYPTEISFADVDPNNINQGFVAVKIGDVNADVSVGSSSLQAPGLVVEIPAEELTPGRVEKVRLKLRGNDLSGFQFALRADGGRILSATVAETGRGQQVELDETGNLKVLGLLETEDILPLELEVEVYREATLDDVISISSVLPAMTANAGLRPGTVRLERGDASLANTRVYPNPFDASVNLTLPTALTTEATVYLYDVAGRRVLEQPVAAGAQQITLNDLNLPAGTYALRLNDARGETLFATVLQRR